MADPDLEPEDPELDPNEGDPEDDPEGDDPEGDPEGDPEADPEEDPEQDPDPEPEPRRVSRAQARVERQQAEVRAARAEAQAAKDGLAALQRQMQGLTQAQVQAQQAERLAAMEPAERERFLQDQRVQGLQREVQQTRWSMEETADKMSWTTKASTDPVAKRYTARVEARLQEMRQNGNTAPRESVYYFLLGQDIATKGPKAIAGARAAGKARVAAARGNPVRGRGDAAAGRRADPDSIEALEARLGKAIF